MYFCIKQLYFWLEVLAHSCNDNGCQTICFYELFDVFFFSSQCMIPFILFSAVYYLYYRLNFINKIN